MGLETALEPQLQMSDIPEAIRSSLQVQETPTEYLVRTFSGATMRFPRAGVHYWWQLMSGVWDNGTDPAEERRREREWELAHDERKFGG